MKKNIVFVLGLASLTSSFAFAANPSVPKASYYWCNRFVNEIAEEIDEDLVLIPYVQKSLLNIFSILNAKGLDEVSRVDNLVAADVRGFAFQLEGISKALKAVDKRAFESMKADAKVLENGIGDYTFETEMKEYIMSQPKLAALVTPRIEALFDGRILATRDRLNQNLRRFGWIGENKAYGRILGIIEDSEPIVKKSKLKRKLLQSMADDLREVHEDIKTGKLDPNEIEDGIHKLRRDLRQVPILMLAFPGMFYLDDEIRVVGIQLSEMAAKNKFVPPTNDLLKRAVGISKNGYLYIGDLIQKLGKLKSDNGMKEYVEHALKSANLGKEATPLLKAVSSDSKASAASFRETRAQAKALFEEIEESKVLLQLADQFEAAKYEF